MTFLVALAHATLVLGYYHGFGVANPLVSLLSTNISFSSFRAFPFQLLGLGGLLVMLVMAVTSHDFWLKNLSPRTWKSLHMAIYPAYAMLMGHVALGALQSDRGWFSFALTLFGAVTVIGLHIAAGLREARFDRETPSLNDAGSPWIDVGAIEDLPEDRARTVCAGGERIAVFKHRGQISAVTNVCAHQGGPLGEGKIIDGCITCPWHGWQYRPADGRSPPPFQEKIATYQVRVVAGRVQVDPRALPPGTPTKPAPVEPGHA
jgi:nitrite reductase/ring-hydroxylating ferredoxin subunit